MSEFCTDCHKRLNMPGKPDIDIQKIFDEKLPDDGTFLEVGLCEGCGLMMVGHIKGKLQTQTVIGGWRQWPEVKGEEIEGAHEIGKTEETEPDE